MTSSNLLPSSRCPAWVRNTALWGYYFTSLPYRRWIRWRDARERTAPVMILFYHRVSDQHPNAWTMGIREFQFQIDWLRAHCDLVSLEEAQNRLRHGNDRPCCSITFDDGYGDNCQFALPYLIRHRVPCTYFVTTSNIWESVAFSHDVACGQPLRPNTTGEIRALSDAGIEIGVHAMHHIDFRPITDKAQLHREVVASRNQLAGLLGREPRYFAFPFGMQNNLNPEVFSLAKEVGYQGVCSAYGAYNLPGTDPFHLQRIHGDRERCRFLNWMTVDPRRRYVERIWSDQGAGVGDPLRAGALV